MQMILDRIEEIVPPGATINPADYSFVNPALEPHATPLLVMQHHAWFTAANRFWWTKHSNAGSRRALAW